MVHMLCFLFIQHRIFSISNLRHFQTKTMEEDYDRMEELIKFDNNKSGVKGLVDSGIKKVPRIFIHAPENRISPLEFPETKLQVPVINLEGLQNSNTRKKVIQEVYEASNTWGFFQITNHGIPMSVLDNMMHGNRKFHELDVDIKAKYYTREMNAKIAYNSNYHLFTSLAADWRDTVGIRFDGTLRIEDVPNVFREEILEYKQHMDKVADTIYELLSEALNQDPNYLKGIDLASIQNVLCHYYPPCPEPEIAVGTTKHADPTFLTLLIQDGHGGLQILHQNQWVPVIPVRGALICNVGDLLQLVSNDTFKSVKHRVKASREGPRLSVATFYSPRYDEKRLYGPIKDALTDENQPIYKELQIMEYLKHYATKRMIETREPALDHFKISLD